VRPSSLDCSWLTGPVYTSLVTCSDDGSAASLRAAHRIVQIPLQPLSQIRHHQLENLILVLWGDDNILVERNLCKLGHVLNPRKPQKIEHLHRETLAVQGEAFLLLQSTTVMQDQCCHISHVIAQHRSSVADS
jgi:hypothetical protein